MSDQSFTRFLSNEQPQDDLRSDYLKALAKTKGGHTLNVCKTDGFGCEDHELDQNGHCRHLIGATIPGDDKHFEPVKTRLPADGKPLPKGVVGFRYSDGSDVQDVLPGDKLVKISVSSRVYRNVDVAPAEPKKSKKELVAA